MTDRPRRNTRRTFLASSALGALSAVATGGAAAETGETVEPSATVEGWRVAVDDWGSARGARAVFRDGSFVAVNAGDPERFGAPGRAVESVTFTDHDGTTWRMDDGAPDADLGPPAVTFTDARATVRESQFADLDAVPGNEISRVELQFVDGTTEVVHSYDGPPWPASLPGVYRGSGAHAGMVIEAIDISYDLNRARHYVRNPGADKHLLGKATPQERLVEVVGATEGAVDYEFTVDGPVRAVTLSDRRGASPEGNDAVATSDGTTTVTGSTGNPGYSDVYAVGGPIVEFARTGGDGDYVLREAEWSIVEDTAPATALLAVVATEAGEVAYEFTVDGTVRPIGNAGPTRSAAGNDRIVDEGDGTVTVEGFTGNAGYGDTYAVTGDVTDFARTGGEAAFRIEYNGHERTPEDLVAED